MSNNNTKEKVNEGTDKHSNSNDENAILVEFTTGDGLRPVGLFSRNKKPELAAKSDEAVNRAMNTIKNMAERVHSTVETLNNRPKSVEVEFGVKFDAEVGAIVAKVTAEASMTVKMIWEQVKTPTTVSS
jgi:Trypsin-co-occurring domain 1